MSSKRIIGLLVGMVFLFNLLGSSIVAASLDDQLSESKEKKAAAQYQVDMTQSTIKGIEAEIVKANDEIDQITQEIDLLTKEINGLEEKISKTQDELKVAETKRQEQEDAMSDRVRTMYMYGNDSILEFIFTSIDFSDFITKIDMSRYIVESDKEALTALEDTKITIEQTKKKIESDRSEILTKKTNQELALSDQQSIKGQKDELLAKNQAIVKEYKAILDAEATNAANIQAQIQASLATQGGNRNFTVSSGEYQWPCPGYYPVADDDFFGTRLHPIWGDYRTHYGVDLGAPSGTSVHAMGNASVISAGSNGGYGNCVIIDLGNGIQAMYAHLSSIHVSSGQTLTKGDVVGAVGSTGDSTGAHLHFGVLLNGNYVDPLGYF